MVKASSRIFRPQLGARASKQGPLNTLLVIFSECQDFLRDAGTGYRKIKVKTRTRLFVKPHRCSFKLFTRRARKTHLIQSLAGPDLCVVCHWFGSVYSYSGVL